MALLPIGVLVKQKGVLFVLPFVLLVLLLSGNVYHVLASPADPNGKDVLLSEWLKSHNVSSAYADYWLANLITWQSNNEMHIRPVVDNGEELEFLYLQSTIRWPYENDYPGNTLITYGEADPIQKWADNYNTDHPPIENYTYNGYVRPDNLSNSTIVNLYVYNCPLPLAKVDLLGWLQKGVKPV
jgi:hypothetical protein